MFDDHIGRAIDGAEVFVDNLERVPAEPFAARAVGQEFAQDFLQFCRIADLHRGVLRDEAADDVRKILHVGPEHHSLAQSARLNWVLAPFGQEALADKDHGGVLVKMLQLAGGVDQQAIDLPGPILRMDADLAAEGKVHSARAQLASDLTAAFEVARNEHEK